MSKQVGKAKRKQSMSQKHVLSQHIEADGEHTVACRDYTKEQKNTDMDLGSESSNSLCYFPRGRASPGQALRPISERKSSS